MDRPIKDITDAQTLITLGPETSVRHAAAVMLEAGIGAVPVVENGKLTGIFSERDVMNRVVAKGLDTDTTIIGDVMTWTPITIGSHLSMTGALHMMQEAGIRHLPVVDGEIVVGILSARDADPRELADFGETLPYKESVLESLR
ncbi:MAG: CBS domain-containing protein [Alphaproteobacteria bacterium]|nr:CBS domain-containing protein [Alphaproteobacteria bacterium]